MTQTSKSSEDTIWEIASWMTSHVDQPKLRKLVGAPNEAIEQLAVEVLDTGSDDKLVVLLANITNRNDSSARAVYLSALRGALRYIAGAYEQYSTQSSAKRRLALYRQFLSKDTVAVRFTAPQLVLEGAVA